MNKPIIAFVTGGYSSEAIISYKSAITIEKNIDTSKYEVFIQKIITKYLIKT